MKQEALLKLLPLKLRQAFLKLEDLEGLQEIRFRVGQPILIKWHSREYGLGEKGICSPETAYQLTEEDLKRLLQCMSDFSLYALEDELRQGFLTIEGGHRIGLTGKAVLEQGKVKTLKEINGMNMRIAHEVIGCSNKVMPYIVSREKVYHTLIISPPGCGKTTLLRDIIRQLSDGFSGYGPYTVGVVDERSELAACYRGIPQNHLGMRTDVLDGVPKVEGMYMLLRSMAPQVIAVDELGKEADYKALMEVFGAGVSVICTVHGTDVRSCQKRLHLGGFIEKGFFERIIVLSAQKGPCTLEMVMDGVSQKGLFP